MPKSDNQKIKILYILDYLKENSHEDHPVRTQEIIDYLARLGISCNRKTVYSDIQALVDFGLDIQSHPGRNGGFFLASRNFELPELKLLIDAVQSSRYLTREKSRELIRKLCKECSRYDATLLNRDVLVSGRVKSMNSSIYYNVDAIQEAICKNRKITFRYFDWNIRGERSYRPNTYVASPYALCQDNENCYLLAHSDRHGATHYRVDRMTQISLSDERRTPCPELTGNALKDYANRLFQMFSGDPVTVRLRFHNSLANVVFDRFGHDVILVPDGDSHFIVTVSVAVSPMFLSWIIGFGDRAKILSPDSVISQCREMCESVLRQYSDPQGNVT